MNNIHASHIKPTKNCEGCRCESVELAGVTGKTKVKFIKIC